ncbi:hypothetical protein K3495_g14077 [Podosphaera aphanis]|nr:hypothetical protein K3495_g14077 [Podosphaera aphanis]
MTTDPTPTYSGSFKSTISSQIFYIAGIITVVYGLDELPQPCRSVACLWLLHPRLQTKETMTDVASNCINDWNSRSYSNGVGLIAVSFDQRNHGSREVSSLANLTWKKGNERHAQDMFGIYNGTAVDTSLLIDNLSSYIFNKSDDPEIKRHLVLGVSLGGHAAWQVMLSDKRITIGVVIIGCPDYARLMENRARNSNRETSGPNFIGSTDFPKALVNSIKKYDPKAVFFGTDKVQTDPIDAEQKLFRMILDSKLEGKRILSCYGQEDKLVPYHCSEPFMKFLANATKGWYNDGNLNIEERFYPGVGHKFTDEMLMDSVKFLNDSLSCSIGQSDMI